MFLRNRILKAWCRAETIYWRDTYAGDRDFSAKFDEMNKTHPTVFLLDIRKTKVSLQEKPSSLDVEETDLARIELYRAFIEECVSKYACQISTTLAIDISDYPSSYYHVPVLTFQKRRSSPNILIPDVDFFYYDWYKGAPADLSFKEKTPGAIFAGSSTGGYVTESTLSEPDMTRIQLASKLLGHPDISFHIAAAVQCVSPEVQRRLESQPYFSGYIPWQKQLEKRFIISVDGNGATCSRVVFTLMSNSVLLKFNSESLLFYFHGLKPFEHFIPVADISDIESILDLDKKGCIDRRQISKQAKRFRRRFLNKNAVRQYMIFVLTEYAAEVFPAKKSSLIGQFGRSFDVLRGCLGDIRRRSLASS
jgi:hypothetical protein